jgi:DNA-binding response OmpR family regulator
MCAPEQPISKDELFKAVWGYEEAGGTNLVEVAVRRLREKIEENPSQPNYLRTVRGAGYKFDAQYARSQQSYFQLVSPSVAYELPVAIAA